MSIYNLKSTRLLFASISVTLLLSLMLVACDFGGGGGPTSTTGSASSHPTPTSAGIQLGPQPCPDAVKSPAHWTGVVGIGQGPTIEHVICGYLMGTPTLQAVVTVRYPGSDRVLDVSIYNNITTSKPTQLFSLHGLLQGDARISGLNTVLTGQADPYSSVNKGLSHTQFSQDLYREFKWSDHASTFAQIMFPGIFPDLTRFQAEFEQDQVNQGFGYQQWRHDVVKSAQNFVNAFLNWPSYTPATVLSGGGAHDYKAIVHVKSTTPGGGTVRISFSRLEGNNNGGLWEATAIETDGVSFMSPQNGQLLSSPLAIVASGTAVESMPGTFTVLDHQYANIGHGEARGINLSGKTTFSGNVHYNASFHGGAQEGVVAFYVYSVVNHSIADVVMVKVLLSA